MAQLRKFHLQFTFRAARATRENIQNQTGTIEHAAFDRLFQVSFLRWTEGCPKQNKFGALGFDCVTDFRHLPRSEQITGRR